MSGKTLTIAIPTYNRAETLRLLLDTLCEELAGLENDVNVIIADNASSDFTSLVTKEFVAAWPEALVLRHEQNLGAEENFCQCVDRVVTPYFWLIGDDDLPENGIVGKIIELLKSENPDLVYLHSEWSKVIDRTSRGKSLKGISYRVMGKEDFSRWTNVWFTFISGMIVKRHVCSQVDGFESTRRFLGTSLVQLGWVFDALAGGEKFIHVADRCVLAKGGNSGGYAIVSVFGENISNIVREVFGVDSAITRIILTRTAISYLPRLIWSVRFSSMDNYHWEEFWPILRRGLDAKFVLWCVLMPIGFAPKFIALGFLALSVCFSKLFRLFDYFVFYFRRFGV